MQGKCLTHCIAPARSNLKGPDLCCPFFVWLDFWGAKPSNTQRLILVMRSGVIPRGACPKDSMGYRGSNPSWPHARQMPPPSLCYHSGPLCCPFDGTVKLLLFFSYDNAAKNVPGTFPGACASLHGEFLEIGQRHALCFGKALPLALPSTQPVVTICQPSKRDQENPRSWGILEKLSVLGPGRQDSGQGTGLEDG